MNGLRVGLTFSCLKFIAVGDALTIILTEPIWTLFLAKVNSVSSSLNSSAKIRKFADFSEDSHRPVEVRLFLQSLSWGNSLHTTSNIFRQERISRSI